jgi:hypothetical protein
MFFVSTAPLAARGLVNCSPKGTDSFRTLGPREVAYLDLTGSGVETIAHLKENQRIVLMFCAFEGPPMIVRLHGRGFVHEPGDPAFPALSAHFPAHPATRTIIRVEVDRIADSCGHGVPRYAFQGNRDLIERWAEKKGADGMADYRRQKNTVSLDGLPGLQVR